MASLGEQFHAFGDQLDDMMKQVNDTIKGGFSTKKTTVTATNSSPITDKLDEILTVQKQILTELKVIARRKA